MITLNWNYDLPTEEGLYLICYGDIETTENLGLFEIFDFEGELIVRAKDGFQRSTEDEYLKNCRPYGNSYKYCKLID